MAHHMMIGERDGERQFMFHHDAAGLVAVLIGLAGLEIDSIPDSAAAFLIGIGLGTLLHHLITELTFEFVEPEEETVEEEAERLKESQRPESLSQALQRPKAERLRQ